MITPLPRSNRLLSIFILHPSDELTDHMPSGDGLVAFGFISALARRGHTIHVATPHAAIRNAFPPNVSIHIINVRPLDGFLSRIKYAIRARKLFNRLRRTIRFDIVQQMNPVTAGLSLGMIGISEPLVLGTYVPSWPYHAHQHHPKPIPIRARLKDLALRLVTFAQICFARALLITSPAATSRFLFKNLFSKRTFEVRHGVDDSLFLPSVQQVDSRAKTIVFLGSLWVRKGILTLIEAFEQVYQADHEATLIVAGSGEIEHQVRAKLALLECQSNVVLLGAVSRSEVPDLMRSAAICCAPGYSEPYATALIEAMASGCAIVISDSGGVPYMVPRAGGRCVPTRDSAALAHALLALLRDPEVTARMGKQNRTFALGQYSWDIVARRLENIYWGLLSGRPVNRSTGATIESFGSAVPRRP